MHQTAQAHIPHFFKACYWIFATGPSLISAVQSMKQINKQNKHIIEGGESISAQEENTYKNIIKEINPQYAEKIMFVRDTALKSGAYSVPGAIFIGVELPRELEQLQFMVGHETSHIIHSIQDTYISYVFLPLFMPFITHATLECAGICFKRSRGNQILMYGKPLRHPILMNALKYIPKVCLVWALSYSATQLYRAHREKAADVFAGKALGPKVCLSAARLFEDRDLFELVTFLDIACKNEKKIKRAYAFYCVLYRSKLYELYTGHPSHKERAHYLRMVAQKLQHKSH